MTKYLLIIIILISLGCTKGQRAATYNYVCTTTHKITPYSVVTTDTVFYNITDADANIYARDHTVGDWYTTCKRQ